MWFSDITQYGRSLAGAAVLLSFVACESHSPKTSEATASTGSSVRGAAKVGTPAVGVALPPPDRQVADGIAPVALETWQLSRYQWDSLNTEWNDTTQIVKSQIISLPKFRLVQEVGEQPRFFFRALLSDSVWREMDLGLPASGTEDAPEWGAESGDNSIDTVNLDGRGAAEVIIRMHPASYGTGSGTAWDYVSVVDVTSSPTLIFRALLAAEAEAFGGYAQLHGYEIEPGEQFTGCKRSFKLRRRELVLGPIRTIGNTKSGECTLTTLPAGRYRYQGGKVLRVGK